MKSVEMKTSSHNPSMTNSSINAELQSTKIRNSTRRKSLSDLAPKHIDDNLVASEHQKSAVRKDTSKEKDLSYTSEEKHLHSAVVKGEARRKKMSLPETLNSYPRTRQENNYVSSLGRNEALPTLVEGKHKLRKSNSYPVSSESSLAKVEETTTFISSEQQTKSNKRFSYHQDGTQICIEADSNPNKNASLDSKVLLSKRRQPKRKLSDDAGLEMATAQSLSGLPEPQGCNRHLKSTLVKQQLTSNSRKANVVIPAEKCQNNSSKCKMSRDTTDNDKKQICTSSFKDVSHLIFKPEQQIPAIQRRMRRLGVDHEGIRDLLVDQNHDKIDERTEFKGILKNSSVSCGKKTVRFSTKKKMIIYKQIEVE